MKYCKMETLFVAVKVFLQLNMVHSSNSPRLSETNITVVNRNMMINRDNKVLVTYVASIVGQPTELECDTRAGRGDRIKLVLWFKNNNLIPIYSYDKRSLSEISGIHWHDVNVLQERASFNTDSVQGRLDINNSKIEDEGTYRCRVDFNIAPTRISEITLTLIVPPKKPMITSDLHSGSLMDGSMVGPYKEGDDISLECSSSGGKPTPSLTWWKNNTIIDKSFNRSSSGQVFNNLEMKKLTRNDLNQMLTCLADNNNISNPISTSVNIDMILPPIYVKLVNDQQHLSTGKKHKFTCKVSGSRPPPIIVWTMESSILKQSELQQTSPDGKVTVGFLSLVPSKSDNGFILSCHAKTPGLPQTFTSSWTLSVTYAPEVKLRFGREVNGLNVMEGENVSLVCDVDANPEPFNIAWNHNGDIVKFGSEVTAIGQHLLFENVGRRFTGTFTCTATNIKGKQVSNALILNVKSRPHCIPSQKVYVVDLNESVNVTCAVQSSGGKVLRVHWAFQNNQTKYDLQRHSEELHSIVYTPRTNKDYGNILCLAENQVGKQNQPCIYQIIPGGERELATGQTNCTKQNITYSTFEIICSALFPHSLQGPMFAIVSNAGTGQVVWSSPSQTGQFLVSGLSPSRKYKVFLVSYDQDGRTHKIQMDVDTLSSSPREADLEMETAHDLSSTSHLPRNHGLALFLPLTAITVIVVCGLLAICGITFAACAQNKRKKLKYGHQSDLDLKTTSQHQSLMYCSQIDTDEPPPTPPLPSNPAKFYSNSSLHRPTSYSSTDSRHDHKTRQSMDSGYGYAMQRSCSSPPLSMPLLHVHSRPMQRSSYTMSVRSQGSQDLAAMPENDQNFEDNMSLSSYSTNLKHPLPSHQAITSYKASLPRITNSHNGPKISRRGQGYISENSSDRAGSFNSYVRVAQNPVKRSPHARYTTNRGGYLPSLTDGGYSSNDGGYSHTYGRYSSTYGRYSGTDREYSGTDGGYSGTDGGYSGADGGYSGTDGCNSGTEGEIKTKIQKYYPRFETNIDNVS